MASTFVRSACHVVCLKASLSSTGLTGKGIESYGIGSCRSRNFAVSAREMLQPCNAAGADFAAGGSMNRSYKFNLPTLGTCRHAVIRYAAEPNNSFKQLSIGSASHLSRDTSATTPSAARNSFVCIHAASLLAQGIGEGSSLEDQRIGEVPSR